MAKLRSQPPMPTFDKLFEPPLRALVDILILTLAPEQFADGVHCGPTNMDAALTCSPHGARGDRHHQSLGVVFERYGFSHWKVTELRMPAGLIQ